MQIKVDILEGLQRKITVEIPSEKVEEQVLQGLKKAQKNAKIDGFRKGKVPMNVIKQRYGSAVRQDVLGELIESSYSEAIKEEKLIPATQPHIIPISGFAANEPFVYEATLEIVPEFDVKGLDNLSIKKPVGEISAEDINNMIDTLRKQVSGWKTKDGESVEENRVIIDFAGKINGEEFEGGSAQEVPVILGAKRMLPEFEEALFNKKAGDNVVVNVNFPEDYHGEDVAGKTAEFTIDVKSVEELDLPEVDEKFIKQFGIADGNREELEKAIRENMQRELNSAIRNRINQQVMAHLVESNQVMLPEGMIAQEKQRIAHEQNLEKSIPDEEARNKVIEESFTEPARRRVLLGLIMSKLLEEKDIKPDAKRVEEHIERIAGTYEDPQEVREYYQKNPNALEQIYAQVMEDQLIDSLLENAEIIEEKCDFSDIMQGKFTQ